LINFTSELQETLTGIGLRPGRMPAFASRIAPLGAVTLGAVSGIFYTFNPELMGRFFPRAWTLASPEDIVAGRLVAVDASLRRLLGPDMIASTELADAAALARAAAEGCLPSAGRCTPRRRRSAGRGTASGALARCHTAAGVSRRRTRGPARQQGH